VARRGEPSASASGGRPSRPERKRVPVTEATLSEALLSYLDRFEGSREKLGKQLEKWVKNRGEPADPALARPLIQRVLARYESAGVIDDERFAARTLDRLRARGGSSRAIAFKLKTKGLRTDAVDRAFEREREAAPNPELEAARALVRRRKLGDFRPEAERAAERRRDLGILARAGFDYETSVSALGARHDDGGF